MNKAGTNSSPANSNPAQQQKKQIQGLKHFIEQLSKFVIRLTKHYDGVTPELDDELQNLRVQLKSQSNANRAEESMSLLTGLILKHPDTFKKQTAKAVSIVENGLKQLQLNTGMSEQTKDQVSELLAELPSQNGLLSELVPCLEKAVEIFHFAIESAAIAEQASSGDKVNQIKLTVSQRLHDEICQELTALVSQLSVRDRKDKQIEDVRKLLARGIDHEELLQCCLVIIKAIIVDVVKERKHAEKFVSGLHKSLHQVNQSVGSSLDQAETNFAKKSNVNESLREHLSNIEMAVDKNDDIAQLKSQANEHLAKLSATLETREQADKEEQMMLISLLSEMKEQLTQLEQNASDFKHRLVEQKAQSHQDSLTQVPNRTAYNERMELEFRRWKRHGNELSMALIDVDHFKNINDSYGHAAGDKTLQVIAQNITKCLRKTDFMARWGGEEFVILFPQTDLSELEKPLEAIRSKIERIPFKFKERKVTITVSLGAANFKAGDTIESVFERADSALYKAKNAGRNRYILNQG